MFLCVCSICACLVLSVSSSSWCLGGTAVCDYGYPWTFLLPFFKLLFLFAVLPCVLLFLFFPVLLELRLPCFEKRELVLVLFVRLFDLRLFGFGLLPLSFWCLGKAAACKAFSKFYCRHSALLEKYSVSLKTLLQQGISEPEFYGDLVYRFRKNVGK